MATENNTNTHRNYLWLISIIALISLVALGLLYHFIPAPVVSGTEGQTTTSLWISSRDLLREVIPNLVAGLIAFLLLYWLFDNRGLIPSQLEKQASEHRIIQSITDAVKSSSPLAPEVLAFYPSFQQVEWKKLISEANLRIDIVVNYFDSWVKDNQIVLADFFKKSKTEMHLYIPDADDPTIFEELKKLYTDSSEASLRDKLQRTDQRIMDVITSAGGRKNQMKVYRLSCRPTYALQRLDNRIAVFSAYDNRRHPGIASPTVVIDLQKAVTVAQYFERELKYLHSKQVEKKQQSSA